MMIPFPSIEKFSQMVDRMRCMSLPELTFRGTVKLHGTHADLVSSAGAIHVQSRNRVLTPLADNAGCALFFQERAEHLRALFDLIGNGGDGVVIIAGEFCGSGIQSKVALCGLPRMFVVVAIKVGGSWADMARFAHVHDEAHGIHNVMRAQCYELRVGAAAPEAALAIATELTAAVDAECPFARQLGAIGPGEGIVWTCVERPWDARLWFKTKGESHTTPVIAKKQRSPGSHALDALLERTMTEERFRQALDTGAITVPELIRWVVEDVAREEAAEMAGIDAHAFGKAVSRVAGAWFAKSLANLRRGL